MDGSLRQIASTGAPFGLSDAPRTARQVPRIALHALLLYFVLEFARPAGIQKLHLQFVVAACLPVAWAASHARSMPPIIRGHWLFLGWCLVWTPFAWNHFAAYLMSRVMFANVAVALGISFILTNRRYFSTAVWVWVAVMVYVACYALANGGTGPGGFIGDENDVALGLCTAIPFAFFGMERFGGWRRIACGGICALLVPATVATLSRGGFVGLSCLALYCLATSRRKLLNASLLVLTAGLFLLFVPQQYVDEIRTIQNTDEGTAVHRFYTWTTAYRMWLDQPLQGAGAGNFAYRAGQYQPRDGDWPWEYFERDWSGTAAHSLYFELLSEQGVGGIVLFAFIGWAHFRLLSRVRRAARKRSERPPDYHRDAELYGGALAAGMVGYLSAGTFLSVSYYPYFWYLSALATAYAVTFGDGERSPAAPVVDSRIGISPR